MCSMSVHYIIQKSLNTNECTKSVFVNYNTLLHVSTLLGHLQGENFRCRYTRLHYTLKREYAVDSALRRLWRREFFVVSACTAVQAETTKNSRRSVETKKLFVHSLVLEVFCKKKKNILMQATSFA
jgi:hypothetical protein